MDNKVRAISKEGKPVMLSRTVAENSAFMKKYGYRIEQVKKEKPVDTPPVDTVKIEMGIASTHVTDSDSIASQEPEKPVDETQNPSDKPTRKTGTRRKRNQSK